MALELVQTVTVGSGGAASIEVGFNYNFQSGSTFYLYGIVS